MLVKSSKGDPFPFMDGGPATSLLFLRSVRVGLQLYTIQTCTRIAGYVFGRRLPRILTHWATEVHSHIATVCGVQAYLQLYTHNSRLLVSYFRHHPIYSMSTKHHQDVLIVASVSGVSASVQGVSLPGPRVLFHACRYCSASGTTA